MISPQSSSKSQIIHLFLTIFLPWAHIYEVFPPSLWLVDADAVVGGSEDVKSIGEDVVGGADDDDDDDVDI